MDSTTGPMSLAFVVAVIAYAVLSTVWTSTDPGWYPSLVKPSFQPPDLVFGVIWPLNFLVLGVGGFQLGRVQTTQGALVSLSALVVSIGFALGWAYLFYVPHALLPAAISLALAALANWLFVFLAWRAEPWVGVLVVVHAAWLSVATALSFAYARLN